MNLTGEARLVRGQLLNQPLCLIMFPPKAGLVVVIWSLGESALNTVSVQPARVSQNAEKGKAPAVSQSETLRRRSKPFNEAV